MKISPPLVRLDFETKMKLAQTNLSELDEAGAAFPLTPALSLGERENVAPSQGMSRGWIRAERPQATRGVQSLFPLPQGEGQGEGEASEHFTGAHPVFEAQTNLSKLANGGLAVAAGARASARFNAHMRETPEMSAPLSVRPLKRRERRAPKPRGTNVSQADLGASGMAGATFPLTPALSLGERENVAPSQGMSRGWIRAERPQATRGVQSLFPLPAGEGQGEGEGSVPFTELSQPAMARN
jgi:hypothetical protein